MLYPKKCDCCGKGMNKGYFDNGKYYCSDRCLIWGNSHDGFNSNDKDKKHIYYDMEDWKLDTENFPFLCYYTEWEELDEDENYDEEGNVYIKCNCDDSGFKKLSGDLCSECLKQVL